MFTSTDNAPKQKRTAYIRVLVGLLQGLALYWLYAAGQNHSGLASNPMLFAPLVLITIFVPTLLVISLGYLSGKALLVWMLCLVAVLAGLAFYDQWRNVGALPINDWEASSRAIIKTKYPSALLFFFTFVACFISHALVSAACLEAKKIANYSAYFDTSWKLLVQLKFSTLFVGALMLMLYLGAFLFELIQFKFLLTALTESWFVIPVCVTAFVFALNLTDVRPAIVNSIRNLLLTLMSWILPLSVLLIGGFLITLPFTGLATLWATKKATAILLFSIAALVLLINTAFQNGSVSQLVPAVLRHSARLASCLLLPLALLAAYALGLRVIEHGWTTDRIIAACCVFVAACYATGYLWAVVKPGELLAGIAKVNVACAMLLLGLILSLFSPLLDPARLSVNNQIERFNFGKSGLENLDISYLKFEGKRFGAQAIGELQANKSHPEYTRILEKIEISTVQRYVGDKRLSNAPPSSELSSRLTVYPKGTALPDSFLNQKWNLNGNSRLPDCLSERKHRCNIFIMDINGDGIERLLIIDVNKIANFYDDKLLELKSDGEWHFIGSLSNTEFICDSHLELLKQGKFKFKQSLNKDIEIGGQRYQIPDRKIGLGYCK